MLNKYLDIAMVGAIIVATAVAVGSAMVINEDPTEPVSEPTTVPSTEAQQVPTQVPTEAEPSETTQPVILYDVPLDAYLQQHIICQAEAHGIDPAIIMAMAFRESTYNPNAVGDGGNSLGLLQVQPKWHSGRMQRLGCPDLFDPYQNVNVGIDYLSEMLTRYGTIEAALTAYNQGHYSGSVTEYARAVLAIAEELRGTTYEANSQGT